MKTELEISFLLSSEDPKPICRLCLSEVSEGAKQLFEVCDVMAYSDKLMLCTRVVIKANDGLPSIICLECCKELELADNFRTKCEYSDSLLKKLYLGGDLSKAGDIKDDFCMNPVDIKEEIDSKNLEDSDLKLEIKLDDGNESDNDADASMLDILCEPVRLKKKKKKGLKQSRKEKEYQCHLCDKQLSSKYSLESHMNHVHSPEKIPKKEKIFYCTYCDYKTPRKQNYLCHERTHTGTKPFKCDECDASFTQRAARNRHKKTHSDKMYYTCAECGKQFKYRESYQEHKTVHTNERKYVCTLCSKGLKSRTALENHMKRHFNIKNFTCEACGKRFVTRIALITHSRVHGVFSKDFHCNICPFSTDTKRILEMHIKRHTGERSFKCELCDYSSHTQSELNAHMTRHTKGKNHDCPNCEMKYRHVRSLRRHMLKTHGLKYKPDPKVDKRLVM